MSNDRIPDCPTCGGNLVYRDRRKRVHRKAGGKKEYLQIRRFRCEKCGRYHEELPDFLLPYKHYDAEIICDVIDGKITEDNLEYEDYPCAATMRRWREWYKGTRAAIEGNLQRVFSQHPEIFRETETKDRSLLETVKQNVNQWLSAIMRTIYNSGGRIAPTA